MTNGSLDEPFVIFNSDNGVRLAEPRSASVLHRPMLADRTGIRSELTSDILSPEQTRTLEQTPESEEMDARRMNASAFSILHP